jgi:hypothetical protein
VFSASTEKCRAWGEAYPVWEPRSSAVAEMRSHKGEGEGGLTPGGTAGGSMGPPSRVRRGKCDMSERTCFADGLSVSSYGTRPMSYHRMPSV